MPRKSILLACFAALCLDAAIAVAQPPEGEKAIVLFGASWCAPCRVELRNLSALASAAAPVRLEIAWIDREPPIRPAAIASNVRILSPQEAQRKFDAITNANQGLPIVAMVDGQGHTCAVARRPASVAVLRRLIAECSN